MIPAKIEKVTRCARLPPPPSCPRKCVFSLAKTGYGLSLNLNLNPNANRQHWYSPASEDPKPQADREFWQR